MKRLNKKTGIAIFTAVMAILAVIILVYHNPLANPQDELLKKVIACVLIVAAVIAFIRLYDKITVLPVELYQNRRLIWKLAKSDFKNQLRRLLYGSVLGDGAAGHHSCDVLGLFSWLFSRTGLVMPPEA